jgi:hypothetical protein
VGHRRRRRPMVRPDGGRSWPGLTCPDGLAAVPRMFRELRLRAASGGIRLHTRYRADPPYRQVSPHGC